jgi:hypothetical protein
MPKDAQQDPLAVLERDQAAKLARKAELARQRAELTYAAATGDKQAQKQLTDLRVESERLHMELSDLAAGVDIAKARLAEQQHRDALGRLAEAAGKVETLLDQRQRVAEQLEAAKLAWAAQARAWIDLGAQIKAAVAAMSSAAANAGQEVDGGLLNRASVGTLDEHAVVRFIRDARLTEVFDPRFFEPLGQAGVAQVSREAWNDVPLPVSVGEMQLPLRAVLARYTSN